MICAVAGSLRPPSGHVFRVERARLVRQVPPAGWAPGAEQAPAGMDRPWSTRAGYFTKRTAEDWLRKLAEEARRGTLPGMVRTGARFADAAAEWLRYIEQDRLRKPSTVSTYRSLRASQLLPTFADLNFQNSRVRSIAGAARRSLVVQGEHQICRPAGSCSTKGGCHLNERRWQQATKGPVLVDLL